MTFSLPLSSFLLKLPILSDIWYAMGGKIPKTPKVYSETFFPHVKHEHFCKADTLNVSHKHKLHCIYINLLHRMMN